MECTLQLRHLLCATSVVNSAGWCRQGQREGRDFVSGAALPNPPADVADETNKSDYCRATKDVLRLYFYDAPAGCGDPAYNFDDLVVWLSTPILFNRMVAAGRLP